MPKLADATRLETAWAERVLANREQAERLREGAPEGDFYAPVSALFVADPRRTGEPALDALRELTEPDETWLDVGAGAGRYALPLALRLREVIALEPSASMRHALRTGIAEHGIANIRIVAGAWPEALEQLGEPPVADVALIAHVAYDIEHIGPFLDALEASARRRCVAVLTDRSPASVADPFWPLVHGEERVPLPALPELLAILRARGRETELRRVERPSRTFESPPALETFVRRQLFIAPGGKKDDRFHAVLRDHIVERDGGWTLSDPPAGSIGIVTWAPRPAD
jgi:SAM-dependent methyltransferase